MTKFERAWNDIEGLKKKPCLQHDTCRNVHHRKDGTLCNEYYGHRCPDFRKIKAL